MLNPEESFKVGYFADEGTTREGICRRMRNGEWDEPHARWWLGRWGRICVGPMEMHTGRWEFDDRATDEFERTVGTLIVA